MNQALKSVAARLVEGFGLAEIPHKSCATHLDGLTIAQRSTFQLVSTTSDVREALEFLSTLTFPATRHVLVPLEGCTAFVDNGKDGSNFADNVWHFARHLQTRAARVVDAPGRTWTNGDDREVLAYEAHILEIRDAQGEVLRSVACSNDGGRWRFETTGTPDPVEASFRYTATRKKDRFTSSTLGSLLRAYGFPRLDADRFLMAGEYSLFKEAHANLDWARRIQDRACTLEQRDDPAHAYYERGLGWLEHIDTRAASVVADFERAVRLNPSYEPLVRQHLTLARKKLAAQG